MDLGKSEPILPIDRNQEPYFQAFFQILYVVVLIGYNDIDVVGNFTYFSIYVDRKN